MPTWASLNQNIINCRRCPRLVEHCRRIGHEKRRAFRDALYWARPVPNFGDTKAKLLIVGLAPAAHGANRTGRMFTGDRSGDWLYRALAKAGLANQPTSEHREDGLELVGCAVTAVCHCAPPDNKPSREEIANCRQWFAEIIDLLKPRAFLALGAIAFRGVVDEARRRGWHQGKLPTFAHAVTVDLGEGGWLVGSYHPSQQNTFTGKLTEAMLDRAIGQAKELAERQR